LEEERVALEHEIAQHHDEVRARARDAHRRIIEDDDSLPRFARAS
jgi:cell division protein FtsB